MNRAAPSSETASFSSEELPQPDEIGPADAQPDPEPAPPSLAAPDAAIFSVQRPASRASAAHLARTNRERLNLYILRHASAGTRRANPKLDVKRPLDKEGKQHCFHLAHVLRALKISFDLVISSPLKRCLQTAQLIGTETGYEARILRAEALEPNAEFAQFERLVHECRSYENVLMVGHNPTLTYFLGQLIGSIPTLGETPSVARVRLRKGSLARVSMDRDAAVLQGMLDPRVVRALYATSIKSSRRKTSRK